MGDFEVDEWDGTGSFAQHAVSGSIAGLAEHSVMFPVDTIKTIMQVRRAPQFQHAFAADGAAMAASSSMSESFVHLTAAGGMPRMWRGVQTMFTGCVPAHGAYFTIYETLRPALGRALARRTTSNSAAGAAAAAAGPPAAIASGAAVAGATMAHDVIMTPMDVCKQRLQLGYHRNSVIDCACAIMRAEGPRAFMISYPVTLGMNVPYALVMGTSNELLRRRINPTGEHSLSTYLLAGAGAGSLAAAVTNPLDVIKTRLQTQRCQTQPAAAVGTCPTPIRRLAYTGVLQTCAAIWREDGVRGFARGAQARVLVHAPSVAICWTTYEAGKQLLGKLGLV